MVCDVENTWLWADARAIVAGAERGREKALTKPVGTQTVESQPLQLSKIDAEMRTTGYYILSPECKGFYP